MSKKLDPLLSLKEVATASGQTAPSIHAAINIGHLRTMNVGRRRFARESDVQAWLDFLQKQSDAGRPVFYRGRRA